MAEREGIQIEKLRSSFAEIVKNAIQEHAYIRSGFIARFIESAGQSSRIWFSNSKKLQMNSGRLYRSIIPNTPENINKVKFSNNVFTWEFGSKVPYASVHELKRPARIKSKGKMHKFFWYKWRSTNMKMWLIMFYSVLAKGYVKVKRRPFIQPGDMLYMKNRKGVNLLLSDIVKKSYKKLGITT